MRAPDVGGFLEKVEQHQVTHTFLPPTLIYMALDHQDLDARPVVAAVLLVRRRADVGRPGWRRRSTRIGPVMAQLFGQTEAPMMISTMAPSDHFNADGSIARDRLSSAGSPAPLVTVAIMDDDGTLLPHGERGEIVVRGSLVMRGLLQEPARPPPRRRRHGWHHTGDIGYLDDDGFLYIVDRAKDMIITGGFNVYSAEVEQAVMAARRRRRTARSSACPTTSGASASSRSSSPRQARRSTPPTSWPSSRTDRLGEGAQAGARLARPAARSKVGKVLKTEIKARSRSATLLERRPVRSSSLSCVEPWPHAGRARRTPGRVRTGQGHAAPRPRRGRPRRAGRRRRPVLLPGRRRTPRAS